MATTTTTTRRCIYCTTVLLCQVPVDVSCYVPDDIPPGRAVSLCQPHLHLPSHRRLFFFLMLTIDATTLQLVLSVSCRVPSHLFIHAYSPPHPYHTTDRAMLQTLTT